MLRRALALVGGLVLLILIVLGVKGCLDARANRELSDYARNVSQIVEETQGTSESFFSKLEDPGNLSVTEFVDQVDADRSAMVTYAERVDDLGAPGDMSRAQSNLELAYDLRVSAMDEISAKMSTALGDAGAEKAMMGIAKQMQKLLAADVIYEQTVRPEADGVLASNGVSGSDLPKATFLPDEKWLDADTVTDALGGVSGASGAATPGTHGLGLGTVSVNGSELVEGAPVSVSGEEGVEVEVTVQNQGESTESGITVSVTFNGETLEGEIDELAAGEEAVASIALTPAPSGEVTLEVEAEPVAGEQVTENNEASYTVLIE
jgi:CARDB protein